MKKVFVNILRVKKFKTAFLFLISCSTFPFVSSQSLLTPEEAVNIALQNNFGILVARNNADIAKINNSPGAAGMLPTISANASANLTNNNVNTELINNTQIVKPSSQAVSKSAGLALSWVLFDGGKMFITKSKLNKLQDLGNTYYKDTIQQTVYNVMVAYYNVVSQKQQLNSVNEAINFGNEQVKILQKSFDAGLTSKSSLLQAKIDLNVFKESAINQQFAIIAAKRALNQILARDSDAVFDVVDSITNTYVPDKNMLLQKLDSSNLSIYAAQKQIEVARMILREYNATRLPKITLSAGYNLSIIDNNASNVTYSRSYGPTIGATISIPIFQAGTINRQASIARIQLSTANYNFKKISLLINTQLQNTLNQYDNLRQLLDIEKENELMAKENVDIALKRLQLGQATSLEVRQAQESYVNSQTRRINFEYSLKMVEIKLKQLVAEL
ncbi:MAG TPA: TolC family protein [Bacteroidales bacterium]